MNPLEQVKAWNALRELVSKTTDRNVRIALAETFRRKAINEWGWIPGTQEIKAEPELDEWEQDFLNDIRDTIEFAVDVRKEHHEDEIAQAKANMVEFVKNGGFLSDIPQEIRTPYVTSLYNDVMKAYADEITAEIDNIASVKK